MTNVDAIHSFHLQQTDIRGQIVRIESAWEEILQHAALPSEVERLLGQSLVASALFTGALKFEGSLSIHLRNAGALRLLFTECTHDGYVRGLARCDPDVSDVGVVLNGEQTQLAITIENTHTDTRYQGLVAVESDSLAKAFEGYFAQSEQLPTRILVASDGRRCAGLIVQRVAASGGSGAAPDEDAWDRIGHLLATVSDRELLDLPVEQLLYRLFHEERVVLHEGRPLAFRCSCSPDRVAAMMRSLGQSEAEAALGSDGLASVTCEFCNRSYALDVVDVAALFQVSPALPASRTGQ